MRVKGGTVTHARRKKILKQAKGYFGSKHLLFKTAKEQVMRSHQYAYVDRRNIKRDFRKLWIKRINAACRMNDISYSKFMHGLKVNKIDLNRKMLSEIAINDEKAFASLVTLAKTGKVAKTTIKGTKVKTLENKETKSSEQKDYSKMTVAELKKIAKENNVCANVFNL